MRRSFLGSGGFRWAGRLVGLSHAALRGRCARLGQWERSSLLTEVASVGPNARNVVQGRTSRRSPAATGLDLADDCLGPAQIRVLNIGIAFM